MANQLKLPPQTIMIIDILRSINYKKIKKIFFQTTLISISNNDVTTEIVAYAAHRKAGGWDLGTPVRATPSPTGQVQTFRLPITIGNCEWVNSRAYAQKATESKRSFLKRKKQAEVIQIINGLRKDKKLLESARMTFTGNVTKNPHLEYIITLESGLGSPIDAEANPSPPATPAE